jgi:hypothetical protein
MEIQEKMRRTEKKTNPRPNGFFVMQKQNQNFGFHRILTSKAHRKREKISRNKN